jgi:hypothetical protein
MLPQTSKPKLLLVDFLRPGRLSEENPSENLKLVPFLSILFFSIGIHYLAPKGMNAHERKYEEWAHFSAVINPDLKYVPRTREEIKEAVDLTK